jgi:hypothetical protein
MKLPEDGKERAKILTLIGLGTIAVIYTLAIGIVRPLKTKRQERNDEIAAVQEHLQGAERELNRMMKNRSDNATVLRDVIDIAITQKCVLQPRLGNYRLEARDFLEAHANTVGVEIDTISPIGVMQLPISAQQVNAPALKAYNTQVRLIGGLHDLVRYLRQIENSNPFLVVSSLSVSAQGSTPGKHSMTIGLQWPVWDDSEMGAKLGARLQELMEFKVPSGRPKVPTKEPRT